MRLLLGSAHLLQERLEGNEALIVGGVAELLHQVLGLLPGPWSPCRPCTWGRHRAW